MRSLFISATVVLGSLVAPFFIQAQSNERVINLYHWRNEPLKIHSIKVKDKEIKPGEKFVDEEDDWFRDLAVEVENISDKTIVHLDLVLSFPKTLEITKPPAVDSIWYGSYQWQFTGEKVINLSQPPIKPGEKATVKLIDYQATRNLLDFVGYNKSLKEFRIGINSAFFDDDTRWVSGIIMIRDPSESKRWIRQSKPTN